MAPQWTTRSMPAAADALPCDDDPTTPYACENAHPYARRVAAGQHCLTEVSRPCRTYSCAPPPAVIGGGRRAAGASLRAAAEPAASDAARRRSTRDRGTTGPLPAQRDGE